MEEQDNYLEQSRRGIDKVLDQVINFKFDAKNAKCISTGIDFEDLVDDANCLDNNKEKDCIDDDDFLTFKTSFDKETLTSSPRIENAIKNGDSLVASIKNDIQGLEIYEDKPPETVKKQKAEGEEKKVTNFHESRKKKIIAMHEISALIQKIENVESLYPNTKALMNSHPKYKDVCFTRNLEALLLWLNINKELYHGLVALANWIGIEPDDVVNWKDWFDCGLGMLSFILLN